MQTVFKDERDCFLGQVSDFKIVYYVTNEKLKYNVRCLVQYPPCETVRSYPLAGTLWFVLESPHHTLASPIQPVRMLKESQNFVWTLTVFT